MTDQYDEPPLGVPQLPPIPLPPAPRTLLEAAQRIQTDAAEEAWRPVVGYEGRYEVSDQGRVRSFLGKTVRVRLLKPYQKPNGYLAVPLCADGHIKRHYIHALVLEAFIGTRPPNFEACHEDGVRANNRVTNLRWDTAKNNAADRRRHGTAMSGEGAPWSTLSADDVRCIRAEPKGYGTGRMLARAFGVSPALISMVRSGKVWVNQPQYL
jgi:hypothetical protein